MYTVENSMAGWRVFFPNGDALCLTGKGEIGESDARRIAAALNLAESGAVEKAREALRVARDYPKSIHLDVKVREALAALGGEVAHG